MSDPVTVINDYRQRIVRAQELRTAEEPIPEGLIPSDEELRAALKALRANRATVAAAATTRKSKAKSNITPDLDLNTLFGGGNKDATP